MYPCFLSDDVKLDSGIKSESNKTTTENNYAIAL